MNRRWRSRPFGSLLGASLLAIVVSTLVVVAPSDAAGAEKTFETNLEAQCVLAPGILNEKGVVKFGVRGEGAERVGAGEEFELHRQTITFTLPLNWVEAFFALGSREVRGRITHFPLDAEGGNPSQVNDAVNTEFPSGAPFKGPVEITRQGTYTVPSGGGTLVSPPVRLNGSGSGLTMKVDPGSGVREISAGHFEPTEEGIQIEITGYNESGEPNIGPLKISCTAPSGVVVATASEGPYEQIFEVIHFNWAVSGSLTPKRLGGAINLPTGSTFTDSDRINGETGGGKISGSLAIPPFTASLRLLGLVPASLGVTLTQSEPLSGSTTAVGGGSALLSLSPRLNLGITSVGVLGLKLPTSCLSTEAINLALSATLTREELLVKGWRFTGTTMIPRLKCEGQFGPLVGTLLSVLLTGPENAYALHFAPPA
jgi:hypothetical protein